MNFTIKSIKPDAKFLFAQLTRFEFLARPMHDTSTGREVLEFFSYSSDSLTRMINEFKSVTASIELKNETNFKQEDLPCNVVGVVFHNNQKITKLSVLNKNCHFYNQWPKLKELCLIVEGIRDISWKVFKTFPNLEKLEIRLYIQRMVPLIIICYQFSKTARV
jgi:hypothetical protein